MGCNGMDGTNDFGASLGGVLSNLDLWEVPLPIEGGLELDGLKGPFQPKSFYDSIILLFHRNITSKPH